MSSTSFSIKSNASNRELVFSHPREDYFVVEIRGLGVNVTREVYAYTDGVGLYRLLNRLAEYSRPWSGVEKWESLEGEFTLAASCTPLGHVDLSVLIRDQLGGPEEWTLKASLVTELGQLPSIAAAAKPFFANVAPPNTSLERTRDR